ncbi:MAG: alpha/beta hydrolase [Candidatus Hydrogenedentes bacterium]|nr:alpha/beta hydrolase [Candidatus Hydrogenedentota bacterium]
MKKRIVLFLIGSFIAFVARGNEIAELVKGAPEVPPGYTDYKEVQKAVLSGQVKLIKPPKELPASIAVTKDIEYGKGGDKPLLLDLYAPKELAKPVPALVFIHGGGWQMGDKKDYEVYCIDYAAKGYVCVTINYRLRQDALFPAAVEDCKAAVRWMRANAAKFGADPEKIAAIGGSAGGHLSMMVGYCDDPAMEGSGGNPEQSSRVQVVVNFYGVPDLTGELAKEAPEAINFLGKKQDEDFALYAKASPLTFLDRSDPPTLSFHGTIDELVPFVETDRLHANLDALGIPNAYDKIEGWPHTMDAAVEINKHCQYVIDRFLEKYLPLPK